MATKRLKHGDHPIAMIPVEKLVLDGENPRLAAGLPGNTQRDLVRVLWDEMAVDEVAFSIAANGYFREEPLLAIPSGKDKYVVVEGNRRLAAVQLLRDDALRAQLGATELPNLSDKARRGLDELPVSVYKNREELWQYFGFRHINGPKPWDAYSKAQYVAHVHEQFGVSLPEIAKSIGDRHSTVERLYRGYKILEQAEANAVFLKADRIRNRFYFSHLYTAADQPEFQRFLGISEPRSLVKNPVPRKHLPELKDLLRWLYGSKERNEEPVVRSQNPDLNTLRLVISTKKGLSALRAGLSLGRAHEVAIGDDRRFRDALTLAKEELLQAKATVTTGYKGEADLAETMAEIIAVAASIDQEMKKGTKKSKIQH